MTDATMEAQKDAAQVKRYDIYMHSDDVQFLRECPDGDYVKFESLDLVCRQRDALQARVDESDNRIRSLEAELERVTKDRDQRLAIINGEFHKRGRIGPDTPDSSMVICPHCTSQFTAISVNDQKWRSSLEFALRPHAKWLRMAADEIRAANHAGWGNTCEQAADAIDAAMAEAKS